MEQKQNKQNSAGWNRIINILFLVIVLIGLFFIVKDNRHRFDEYREVLFEANYFYLILVVLFTMVGTLLRTWRWYYLLLPIKETVSYNTLLRVNINALAANYSIPGKMGVPVKAVLLKKSEGIDYGQSFPSIFGELFIEHSAEFVLAIAAALIGGHVLKLIHIFDQLLHNQSVLMNIMILVGAVVLMVIAWMILKKKLRTMHFFDQLISSFRVIGKKPRYILICYLISIVNLIALNFAFLLVFKSFGHAEVGLTFVIFAAMVTNFVSIISPLPGGLGLRELTSYGLYDLYFGIGGIAFLAILTMRLITYISLLLLFVGERAVSYIQSIRGHKMAVGSGGRS